MSGEKPFLDEVSTIETKIQSFNKGLKQISDLHKETLNSVDEQVSKQNRAKIDEVVGETKSSIASLSKAIRSLANSNPGNSHVDRLKAHFKNAINSFQKLEKEIRDTSREKAVRQYKIAKPDATQDEVDEALKGQDGVFSSVTSDLQRFAGARAVGGEVRQRHQELKAMENTLGELASLMNAAAIAIEQQDETILDLEKSGAKIEEELDAGRQELEETIPIAQRLRKMRFLLLIICLLIVAAIAVAIAVPLARRK